MRATFLGGSRDGPVGKDNAEDTIRVVGEKGAVLWVENGQLHYKAPRGALTLEDTERLKRFKAEIVCLLENSELHAGSWRPNLRNDVPLTFSQVAHWQLYGLSDRRAIRQLASAIRLVGDLSFDTLQESVAALVARHEALRTQIVLRDGVPSQSVLGSVDHRVRLGDLTTIHESAREAEVLRRIEQMILEPIDVTAEPLFGLNCLRLRADEHVLLIAMEHLISDAFSMSVFVRELLTIYSQRCCGTALSLPRISVQFPDYAIHQQASHAAWVRKHGKYWDERLAGCQRLRFPEDRTTGYVALGWGSVSIDIDRDLKAELSEWCRRTKTTLAIGAFTAYVALVLRWCDTSDSVVQYVVDGRSNPEHENTIGYFASTLCIRIQLLGGGDLLDLLQLVTEECFNAYQHADRSFIAASVPRPGYTRNTVFNWVPRRSIAATNGLLNHSCELFCSEVQFANPTLESRRLDCEPYVVLYDTPSAVLGSINYPVDRFSARSMEKFSRSFLTIMKTMIRQPHVAVRDMLLT
jgi:hypothetical protein